MNQARPVHWLHTALLLLVLCNTGHIHNHVCLDGQEPADLVHFENLGGHPDHHEDDAAHSDIENELIPQVLLTKTLNQDSPLFALSVALMLTERLPLQRPHYLAIDAHRINLQPSALKPPSRGPPPFSV